MAQSGNAMKNDEGTFSRYLQGVTFSLLLVPLVLTTIVWTLLEFALFASSSGSMEAMFIDDQKDRVRIEIQHVAEMIEANRDLSAYRLRQVVRERTEQAYKVIVALHGRYQGRYSSRDITGLAVEALRPIRFNNDRGYYFITDITGVKRLFAAEPGLEGKNLLEEKSHDGRFIVREMIDLALTNGEGFITYPWTHPFRPGSRNTKTSYIKYFAPLELFVGYGEYEADIESDIQEEVLRTLGQLTYGQDGYIFAYRYTDGILLQNVGNPELVNTNVQDLSDSTGTQIVKDMTRVALSDPKGGFVKYSWKRPSGGRATEKISYVRLIPDWNWVVGTGLYLDDIQRSVGSMRDIITLALQVRIGLIAVLMVLTLVLVLALSRRVSRKVGSSLDLIGDFLGRAFRERVKIPLSEIRLSEFRNIAALANQSVDDQREVMGRLSYNERRYRSLFEASNDAIFIHEAQGQIIEVNERARLLFPVLRRTGGLVNLLDLFEGQEQRRVHDYLRVLQTSGVVRMEVSSRSEHDEVLHLDMASNIIEPGQSWAQTLMRDITSAVLSREKIERLNTSLSKTIEAQSRDLADAHLLLLKTEQMAGLGRLVSVFGHEVGTPLGIGITLASMSADQARTIQAKLAQGTLTKSEIDQFIATLVESSDLLGHNLQRATDLMANLKLIAVDQASNEVREFNLRDYLERIIQSLDPSIRKSPHSIELSCPPDLLVETKPGLWYQILTNLVNNSLMHAFEPGQVGRMWITVTGEKSFYTLVYEDNGRGIPMELQSKVFDEFFTTKRGQGGSGLGLSIVKNLSDELGAQLKLESSPGKGVRFTLVLESKP